MAKLFGRLTCWVAGFSLIAIIGGCSRGEPFDYVKVTGTATYEDGSLIPGERVVVTFLPQAAAIAPAMHPRPGIAEVDVKSGRFDCVTSHKYGDGIVPGKHKVLIQSIGGPLRRTAAVPVGYTSADKTPLVVDAQDTPFHFRIPKAR
jgi:hypothetical protein